MGPSMTMYLPFSTGDEPTSSSPALPVPRRPWSPHPDPLPGPEPGEQPGRGRPQSGVERPRGDLDERLEHEPAAVHPRVRNHQAALPDLPPPEKHDVDIDPPRTVAEGGAFSHPRLDLL